MGQKHEIKTSDVISFEMIVKLQYKNCEMTFKKINQVHRIDAVEITEKGYIVEFSETFLAKEKICPNLVGFLNNVANQDLDMVYKKLQNKKNLRDELDSNN